SAGRLSDDLVVKTRTGKWTRVGPKPDQNMRSKQRNPHKHWGLALFDKGLLNLYAPVRSWPAPPIPQPPARSQRIRIEFKKCLLGRARSPMSENCAMTEIESNELQQQFGSDNYAGICP